MRKAPMTIYSTDIYTERTEIDVHTLDNLGPLTRMAGIWKGSRSLDVPPKPEEAETTGIHGAH